MIILHAGFDGKQLFLWGEKSLDKPLPASKRRGRPPKTQPPQPYPYAVNSEELLQVCEAAGLITKPQAVTLKDSIYGLPSIHGRPIPSSPLIANMDANTSETLLSHYLIPGCTLPAAETLDLLTACAGQDVIIPGLLAGYDLYFWLEVVRFAAILVAEQQYLPTLNERSGSYHAQWQAFLRGSKEEEFKKLAAAMPAVCRTLGAASFFSQITPDIVLLNFLHTMIDAIVRLHSETPIIPSAKGTVLPLQKSLSPANLHDRWLNALTNPAGTLEGEKSELQALTEHIQEWQRRLTLTAHAPFRLCFRLEEPIDPADPPYSPDYPNYSDSPDLLDSQHLLNSPGQQESTSPLSRTDSSESSWYLRYLLQSNQDPSLYVSVDDVWKETHRRRKSKQDLVGIKEYLLAALGQASTSSSSVEESLKSPAPGGWTLTTAEAHAFLTDEAPALEQMGFGMLLPSWWARQGSITRLSVRAKVRSSKLQTSGNLSLDQVVHFDWEVALGDENITLAELQHLAELKSPLVKLRGQWVQLSAAEIESALSFWRGKAKNKGSVRDIVHLSLGAGARSLPENLPLAKLEADGWIKDLLEQLNGQAEFAEVAPPPSLQATLRPYQVRGYSWLVFLRQWGLGACLADDMGLGKTIQTLTFLLKHQLESAVNPDPTLLVCPTSILSNWQKEAERFTPELKVMIHHGPSRSQDDVFAAEAQQHALVLTSYGLLHRDFATLSKVSWSGIILDEAQNIKNAETKLAQAARALPAGFHIALTGTPVENNVGDLWSIMEFLNPGFLGTQTDFKRHFLLPIQVEHDLDAVEQLKRQTRPFILRRLKTDKSIIADLPEKIENKIYANLTREQASLYTAVVEEVNDALNEVEGIERRGLILSTLSKLKQICNHPAQFLSDNTSLPGRSGKLIRLTEMLDEVRLNGEKALIFTQFAQMGELLRRHLQEMFGREVLFLHGALSKLRRDEMVQRFQGDETGELPFFILSLKAGGTGLNLTQANHVFHFDRWWNPAVENQATDRAFRIGQTKNVLVHKFVCAGTLEEKIDAMISHKAELANQVVSHGEGWLTELSTDQLRDLWSLSRDAVQD